MTDKSPKTRTELEALVLARLRAAPQCGGASHVTVVPYADHRVTATWEVASFNPGTSEWEKCERALCEIVSRLQQVSIFRNEMQRLQNGPCRTFRPFRRIVGCRIHHMAEKHRSINR